MSGTPSAKRAARAKTKAKANRIQRVTNAINKKQAQLANTTFAPKPGMTREELEQHAKKQVELALSDKRVRKANKVDELTPVKIRDDISKSLTQYMRHHVLASYLEELLNEGLIKEEDRERIAEAIANTDRATVKFLETGTWIIDRLEASLAQPIKVQMELLKTEPLETLIPDLYFGLMSDMADTFPALADLDAEYGALIDARFAKDERAYLEDLTRVGNLPYLTSRHLKRMAIVTPMYQTTADVESEEVAAND